MTHVCEITITQSRINKGLIAIPRKFSSVFPDEETEIKILLGDSQKLTSKRFSHYTSSTKESRIYGMNDWYATNRIKTGDTVVIERLNENQNVYRLLLKKDNSQRKKRKTEK